MLCVGIDPGVNGGIAVIDGERNVKELLPSLDTPKSIWENLGAILYSNTNNLIKADNVKVVIEQVSGYVPGRSKYRKQYEKDGGNAQPGSRAFTFGRSYGWLEMALVACGLEEGVDYQYATPQKWIKYLGIPKRTADMTDSQWKNVLKSTAQRMYPDTKITLKTADALLLAEYCLQLEEHKNG